ncbi:MAG: LLM class flavin-dependent oxidoreductase [Kouleothrix sp.]|jgi:alkanesulfonate monooxygenase SsuD/methylene tetrahydromethanopterin reductase-like flavin-dependent oxidoreductase (luciferase family)|nr:LLM class flavin-dependent oxidoreductase [Kouleothrix sp.]
MLQPALGVMFRCQYPPELLRAFAGQAERAGFDELWIVEDCFWGGAIASTTAALGATERIAVGLGIMPAVARNPAFVAMELATLARLFPGRLLPGFGHGVAAWMQQVGALPASQLAALEETTLAVRALLRGERYSVGGRHVQLDQVQLDLPPRMIPPVALGVRGPKSLALAGRAADGTILAECAAPAYVAWAREQIARGAAAAGRTEPHRLTVYAWCSVDADGAAARAKLRPVVAATLASAEAGVQLAPLAIAGAARAMAARGEAALCAEMPDPWLDALAVCGTPSEGAAAIERLYSAGADSVVLVPFIDGDPLAQLESIARDLVPLLQRGNA